MSGMLEDRQRKWVSYVDDTTCGSSNTNVVDEADELDVKYRTFSHPTYVDTATVLEVSVQSRLRTIRFIVDKDGLFWGGRASELLNFRVEGSEGVLDLLRGRRRSTSESNRGTLEVTIENRNAVAGGGDLHRVFAVHLECGCVVSESTENLGQFPFHLFLLFSNVRDDVVEDIERRNTRIASTGDGLHRSDHDGFEGTECLFESVKRDRETGRGAVGVGNDETLFEAL